MEITFKNISGHVTIKIYIQKNIVNNITGHVTIKNKATENNILGR